MRTSIADADEYRDACRRSAAVEETFARFRREPALTGIWEHVTVEQGAEYLDRVLKIHDQAWLDPLRANDRVGGPHLHDYGADVGEWCPSTLRYAKVLTDLESLVGDLSGCRIVEIGPAYGGLATVIWQKHRYRSYTALDLPETQALLKKYCSRMNVPVGTELEPRYDLAVSTYAYSELVRPVQAGYMADVLARCDHVYMIYNHIGSPFGIDSYDARETGGQLEAVGFEVTIRPEDPLTHLENVELVASRSSS